MAGYQNKWREASWICFVVKLEIKKWILVARDPFSVYTFFIHLFLKKVCALFCLKVQVFFPIFNLAKNFEGFGRMFQKGKTYISLYLLLLVELQILKYKYIYRVSPKKRVFCEKRAITTSKLIQNPKVGGVLENSGWLLHYGHWDFQNWNWLIKWSLKLPTPPKKMGRIHCSHYALLWNPSALLWLAMKAELVPYVNG